MFKKITLILLICTILVISINTAKANNVELIDGEYIKDDMIIGNTIKTPAHNNGELKPFSLRSNEISSPNYAISTETLQFIYDGYLQFRAIYKTKSSDGYGLVANRNVRQGWIDYTRQGSSVIGGRKYTEHAANIHDTNLYSVSAKAYDSLIPLEKYTTYFERGWYYFQ
ncbi:hypothetical protein ABGF34_08180 [Helcococcus ovis]